MKKKKVLLAFSGGLDTSYCAIYLSKEKGYEVHSAIVNTGGFDSQELTKIEEKAKSLGVTNHYTLEETETYYSEIVKYLVFGNVLRNNTYPLSVSSERVHQAIALVQKAKAINADAIAHGSTGAGNDQIRFDLLIQLLDPTMEIITPIRDQKLSREEEINYLIANGINSSWEKSKYSINKGLWGTSIGGDETLTSHLSLPNEAYTHQNIEQPPLELSIQFKEGELVGINDEPISPIKGIKLIDKIGKQYGIGRDTHVGDTIIGLKGRVGFEAPAALMIIKAHELLEKHTLTKWQIHWKEQLGNWYGMFLHEAKFLDPVMRNIEAFLESTQKNVSGKVHLKLHPNHFQLLGVSSDNDLMNNQFGTYGEMNKTWSAEDVKGFIKIESNALKIFHQTNTLS
ncbi:MAG: argininosuccinate synthase [Crocinitomicaceae bacterium]|nr:argininosuccinate synthase [Crocinitomicaceae bacterium]